jgi:hypothetical protein
MYFSVLEAEQPADDALILGEAVFQSGNRQIKGDFSCFKFQLHSKSGRLLVYAAASSKPSTKSTSLSLSPG